MYMYMYIHHYTALYIHIKWTNVGNSNWPHKYLSSQSSPFFKVQGHGLVASYGLCLQGPCHLAVTEPIRVDSFNGFISIL